MTNTGRVWLSPPFGDMGAMATEPTTATPSPTTLLSAIAATQHGVFERRQALDAGVTERQLRARLRSGQLTAVTRRVLRSASAPWTPMAQAWAALLDLGPGAAISRPSALAQYRVPGHTLAPVHVVVPRARRSGIVEPAQLHTSTALPDEHLAVVNGLLTTTPARTVLDMAAVLRRNQLERLIDRLWAKGLLLPSQLVWMADGWGRGRANADALRHIAAERSDQELAPESNTESRLAQVLRDAGQPPMRRQVWVGGDQPVGRIDFVDDDAWLLLEVQSELFHGSLSDRRRDAERHAQLRALGWDLMEAWEHRVWHDGPALAAEIGHRRAAGRRRRRSAA